MTFVDISESSGINFHLNNYFTKHFYMLETLGGGAAVLDYDGDGWLDIFFVNGAPLGDGTTLAETLKPKSGPSANRLYRNKQDGTFEDVTDTAGLAGSGYGMGVACGDYDNDGDPDIYVTAMGRNFLYRNNGDGSF
ncbi:MAG: FG-GAP repeat domain-containing protein, partial [bacterium]